MKTITAYCIQEGVAVWRADVPDPGSGSVRKIRSFKGTGTPPSRQRRATALQLAVELQERWLREAEANPECQ